MQVNVDRLTRDQLKSIHNGFIIDFLQNEFPSFAQNHFNTLDLGINVRPLIVGGTAYQLHMINNNLKDIAIKTDDIDIKFVIRDLADNSWKKMRIDLLLLIYSKFMEFSKETLETQYNLSASVWIRYQGLQKVRTKNTLTQTLGPTLNNVIKLQQNNGNSEQKIQNAKNVTKIKNVNDFYPPVDLVSLCVQYTFKSNPDEIISMGLIDAAAMTQEYTPHVFNMFRAYKTLTENNLLINDQFIDNNIEMYKILPENSFAVFESYTFILLDTSRMIAKVELLKLQMKQDELLQRKEVLLQQHVSQQEQQELFEIQQKLSTFPYIPENTITWSDTYKYVKYIRKFYHLIYAKRISKAYRTGDLEKFIKNKNLANYINNLENLTTPDDEYAIILLHDLLLESEKDSKINALSKWIKNDKVFPAISMYGGGNSAIHSYKLPTRLNPLQTNIEPKRQLELKPKRQVDSKIVQTKLAKSVTKSLEPFFEKDLDVDNIENKMDIIKKIKDQLNSLLQDLTTFHERIKNKPTKCEQLGGTKKKRSGKSKK